ncbi:WbqC family protein [Nonomuraea purpurea]|uniref:WbqC family protein n=1 Tax=Nonomuraea purpurea TaxID=1849276 RepID=A0ABV8GNS7_9ACTN
MGPIVTCQQPTYLPWPGLFHKLALADVFVVMDTVAFSRKGWINRNRVKGANGPFWITVPLAWSRSASRRLCDLVIDSDVEDWQHRHWESLRHCYAGTPFWPRYAPVFEDLYLGRRWTGVVQLNLAIIERLMRIFGIDVEIVLASELGQSGRGSRLVLDHCLRTAAGVYVSGVNGHDYLIEEEFLAKEISVFYQRYRVPDYPQRHGAFVPGLSAVDLLFNMGSAAAATLLAGNVRRRDLIQAVRTSAPAIVESTPSGTVVVREPYLSGGASR